MPGDFAVDGRAGRSPRSGRPGDDAHGPSTPGTAARLQSRLVMLALAVTLLLLPLGAWVRLSDAGLGCPDWPGCYGQVSPGQASEHIARAVAAQGGEQGPVSLGKAWREMVHRYVAAFLGLLLVGVAVVAVSRRRMLRQPPLLHLVLLGVVVLQGLFGKWTVTMLLRPAIVTGHLLGGMTVLGLLVWLVTRPAPGRGQPPVCEPLTHLRPAAAIALALVVVQIALGGWVSTNYAGLACVDLPMCQGTWVPSMSFGDALHVTRELGRAADGSQLSLEALTAIHWTHRVGALFVTAWLGTLAWAVVRAGAPALGFALGAALVLQVGLGLANVLAGLPLPLAVAHNAGAAVLLAATVALNARIHPVR